VTLGSWFFWPHDFGRGINKNFLFIYLTNPNVKYIHWLFNCNQYFRCNFCVPYEKFYWKNSNWKFYLNLWEFIHSSSMDPKIWHWVGLIGGRGGGSGSSFVIFLGGMMKMEQKRNGCVGFQDYMLHNKQIN